MSTIHLIKSIEQRIKDQAPERMQSDIAQAFRDIASQKLTPAEGLNEIQRIKQEAKK